MPAPLVKMNRMPELDGLRGVAILLVVFFHYFVQHVQTRPGSLSAYAQKYFSICWLGVDIFFVLSGFLVGGILMDQRQTTNYFRVFYLRRIMRIVPPYLLFLATLVLSLAWWNHSHPAGMRWLMADPFPLWSFMLYVQNFLMAAAGKFGPNFSAVT
jgi:peptidoglycan/LPS O-acetylase OafA/YrhL